jgi:tight adherence protein B
MIVIYFIAIYTILAALSIFFYINISIISERYHSFKSACVLNVGFSFSEKIKYFALVGKELYRFNFISATIFGLIGFYFHMGFIGVLAMVVFGWYLPKIILSRYRKKYFKKMDDQIYSSLILIGNGIKANESLVQAIESSKAVLGNPISNEFDILLRQVRIGLPVEEALENMAQRVPLEDLQMVVKAINVSIKTGADLPAFLKKLAEIMRARNALNAKIDGLTFQGRAQGVVVGLLPVFLGGFLYLNDHSYILILFNTFLGNCILALMIILETSAFLLIKKITSINI